MDSCAARQRGQARQLKFMGRSLGTAKLKRSEILIERQSTRAHLIDVAEELFGLYGLDGISLREIAAAAGQANQNVVQYHFKDKAGLIQAIALDRVMRAEKLRREMLEQLTQDGDEESPRALLAAILLPTLAFYNVRSGHVFCRFLLQCYMHPESGYGNLEGVEDALKKKKASVKTKEDQLASVRMIELLQERFKDLASSSLFLRLKVVNLMFLSSVVEFDNAHARDERSADFDPELILDMAVAALSVTGNKPPSRAIKKAGPANRIISRK